LAQLISNSYGKTRVRLTKVARSADRHELAELSVDVTLHGDFERSYTHGDNSQVVATDSMKNTVYVLAKESPVDSPEGFAVLLAEHFLWLYPQVSMPRIDIEQSTWRRIDVGGQAHPTAFVSGGNELRTASVSIPRSGAPTIEGGLRDLLVLKTTDSAFAGFVRDRYTTLPEVSDRILATSLTARWQFKTAADFNGAFSRIRTAMLETFARHRSDAVQQTLYDMGTAALAAERSIEWIDLHAPNKHRIPFNLTPFGLEFANDIFVTTDEPSGSIRARIGR
jgi:urate oxidase